MKTAALRLLLCAGTALLFAADLRAEEAAVPEELIKQAQKQISRLSSSDFDEREAALKRLFELDPAVMPWLREQIEARRPAFGLNDEIRGRLKQVLERMETRTTSVGGVDTSKVNLSLAKAGPKEILAELEKQSHNVLPEDTVRRLTVKEPADFSFTGNYWDAVDALFAAYPPKVDGKWKRESLGTARAPNEWCESDFDAWNAPHANSGVCRVRVARVSLEREARGQGLSVVLVPLLEPRYTAERLDMSVEVIKLAGSRDLQAKWSYEPPPKENNRNRAFMWGMPEAPFTITPASECCFVAKAGELAASDRTFSLEGTVSITLREVVQMIKPLRLWSQPVKLPEGGTIQIAAKGRNSYEVRVVGDNMNQKLNRYQNCVRFLDDKDQTVEAKVVSTGMQSGGKSIELSQVYEVTGAISRIEVTALQVPKEVEVPFKISNIPLPVPGE